MSYRRGVGATVFVSSSRIDWHANDLLRVTLWLWPGATWGQILNWPSKNKKHIWIDPAWREEYDGVKIFSPSLSSWEVIHEKNISPKRTFSLWWPLVLTVLDWSPIWGHRSIAEIEGYPCRVGLRPERTIFRSGGQDAHGVLASFWIGTAFSNTLY